MELVGKIVAVDLDYLNHRPKITIELTSQRPIATQEFAELQEKERIRIGLEEDCDKRSRNANNALWKLCSKIADKLGSSKDEVYFEQLKKYGQSFLVPLTPDTNPKGYFKYYEFREKGQLSGKPCDWYVVYKGSSEYTTKEMSILLQGTNDDCREIGLETIEDYKIKELLESWEGNGKVHNADKS